MNRKLSNTERMVWLVDRTDTTDRADHSIPNLNTSAVARISGRVDEPVLRTALNWLQKRNAMLRVRVDIAGGRIPVAPEAEVIPPISLRVEKRLSDEHWEAEALYEMNHALPWTRGPLMTVVLLTSDEVSDIVVTLHHVMNDTASVLYLTRDLLSLLIQAIKGTRTPIVQTYPERRSMDDLPLGRAKIMEGLMKTTGLMATQVANALRQRTQKVTKRNAARRALPKSTSPKHGDALHQTGCARMLHYVMSAEETALLLEKCKEENTTVHGALSAAAMKAAGQHVCEGTVNNSAAVPISLLSSTRMRRALPDKQGLEIGMFVPMVTAAHYIGQRAKFWEVARHTETSVQDALRRDDPLMALPLPRDMAQRLSERSSGVLLVTNVGRLGIPNPYGAIVVNETKAAADNGMADCFGVVVNQLPNRLMLSFFYPESSLSEDCVGLLGASMVKQLREAISAD